ncbi:uncharacterized protein [Parasteatoda tepidariorum]|uniref:uncharacterized protein n=1 Tax=Parasteatoda tepidariorum TaxID=114398 RepID=UPI001C727FEE|nr:uncharacterized protein LOC122270653 [Parasteatoda tepidariorum]
MNWFGMCTGFSKYVFLCTGLPVYVTTQTNYRYTFWYLWRMMLIITFNANLIHHTYRMIRISDMFDNFYSFIEVLITAVIADSLIEKFNDILRLQQLFIEDLISGKYKIKTSDRRKLCHLWFVIYIVLLLCIIMLIEAVLNFDKVTEYIFHSHIANITYISVLALTSWIISASNTMFYCTFCLHLKSMFRTLNSNAKKLRRNFKFKRCCMRAKLTRHIKLIRKLQKFSLHKDISINYRFELHKCKLRSESHYANQNIRNKNKFLHVNFKPSDKKWKTRFVSIFETFLHSSIKVQSRNISSKSKLLGTNVLDRSALNCVHRFNRYPDRHSDPKYRNLKNNLSAHHTLAHKIQNLHKRFLKIEELVRKTNDIFSLQVLVIILCSFARTCWYFFFYLTSKWTDIDPSAKVGIVIQIIFDFTIFGLIVLSASVVSEEANQFAPIIKRLCKNFRCIDLKAYVQSEIACTAVYATNVELTAWKLFSVSRNFGLTFIGVTVTYVLVIFQLHQVVTDSNKCG